MSTSIPKLEPGCGRICCTLHGNSAVLSELSSTYPLKLISPRVLSRPDVAIVYVLSYGGGLVGGDGVHLSVKVEKGSSIMLLSQVSSKECPSSTSPSITDLSSSQGSTKVFTTRLQQRQINNPSTSPSSLDLESDDGATIQKMDFSVSPGGALYLLPDPVTCFRSASYKQLQTFHLAKDSTLVLLDWITSGRKSRGEEWVFSRYYSLNEIFIDGARFAKDALLLEEHGHPGNGGGGSTPRKPLAERLAPYSCYANVILYGPQVSGVVGELTSAYEKISIMKLTSPPELLWSLSPIVGRDGAQGMIVRVAGKETELVKDWLKKSLGGLAQVVGPDVYRRAFAQ
ncbi:hypothetical protein PQX77_008202 [Marasmius sp. AFHP31]|nr:hypothetical protein PQX77_008261 [Marasmius sp. AFHP31]KAK1228708.1 hypothetical protein PQX77_008202 [Marasmius sp. AFHP31]